MSLSQLANEANKTAAEQRQSARREYLNKVSVNCEAMIEKLTGSLSLPVVFLDTVTEYSLKTYRKGEYNEARKRLNHEIHRYLVDDIVLRLKAGTYDPADRSGTYAPEIGYVAVERECEKCSRNIGKGGVLDEGLPTYTVGGLDYQAKRFVDEVGKALRKRALCTFCAAEVANPCQCCGRSN